MSTLARRRALSSLSVVGKSTVAAADYRVAYAVRKTEVWILAIRHGPTVYADVPSRPPG